jgi:SpoVK/Ycf46/Vps4 family AAA+-type ATPase
MYPLETRQDFCCLHTGQQFGVPFDQLIIFSTNLNPHSLADEAFLRRIRHKIFIGYVTPNQYISIFRKVCLDFDMEFDEDLVRDILDRYYVATSRPLSACHPRDLVENLVDRARFLGQQPQLTAKELDSVCQSYFLRQADISNYDSIGNIGDARPLS